MVRGLQKTAEDGQHARFAAAQAATRARREATKLAASSAAPLAEVVAPALPLPPKPRLGPPSKTSKATPKLVSDVEATPPTSLFLEGTAGRVTARMSALLTPRLRTPKRKPPAAAATVCARRINNMKLSRAWAAWVDSAAAIRTQRRACAILMRPQLSRGMATWSQWYDGRIRAFAILSHAIHKIRMLCELRAFHLWAQRGRFWALSRDAALILSSSALASALRSWNRIALHRAFHKRYQEGG